MTTRDEFQQRPTFQLLSDEQKEAIHFAALEILRRVGVSV